MNKRIVSVAIPIILEIIAFFVAAQVAPQAAAVSGDSSASFAAIGNVLMSALSQVFLPLYPASIMEEIHWERFSAFSFRLSACSSSVYLRPTCHLPLSLSFSLLFRCAKPLSNVNVGWRCKADKSGV